MEVESGDERQEDSFADSSDGDQLEAILCQDGLPLDQISSIPSSRFSGEIATLRRGWEHASDIASKDQWSEDGEEDCIPCYVDESEGELSVSVFQHDTLSDIDRSPTVEGFAEEVFEDVIEDVVEEDVLEDDRGDGGMAIQMSNCQLLEEKDDLVCQLEEKDDLVCQLQEQLRNEKADKLHADDVNKSLQEEYERVRKRLAECEMHIDRLRLAPSVADMATKNITLVYEYEGIHAQDAASSNVVSSKPSPTSVNACSSNHSQTSSVELDSTPVSSRSRTPDGGSLPPPVRPGTQQRNPGVSPSVNDTRKRIRQKRESLNPLPMDEEYPTHCSAQGVKVSDSEERIQPDQRRKEEVECPSVGVNQIRGAILQEEEEEVLYSLQDDEEEDSAPEGRAVEPAVHSFTPSPSTSTSVLQLVSELSNGGSIAGFLAKEDNEVLPFSFSEDSLLLVSQCEQESVGNAEQGQGQKRMLTHTSTPVLSVKQPADRQVSQTSRQPKQSRLRQPQAGYRPLPPPDPAHWRLELDEIDDICASEGSKNHGHVVRKPSRIPTRDHTHPLEDMPTSPHHIPISHPQEQGLPLMYTYAGEMESGFVGSEESWKSQRTGVREEAGLGGQVTAGVQSAQAEKSPSQSDGRTPAAQYCSSAQTHAQLQATPKGGPTLPIPTPSHLAERGLGPPKEKAAELDGLGALQKQLTAVQEELKHLSSLQHPQMAMRQRSMASKGSLPPSGGRQRTSSATARRGNSSSSSCPPSGSEQVAMVVSPPHSGQNSQLSYVMKHRPYSESSHQPETHTAHLGHHTVQPEVRTADLEIHKAGFGDHSAQNDVHTAHHGGRTANPEVHTDHHGGRTANPEVHTDHHGGRTANPEVHTAHHRGRTANPGVHTDHRGIQTPHSEVYTAHPDVHTAHYAVHTTERGTSPMCATVASRGTDPLHPTSHCGTSPVHHKITSSGTAPRMISQGTVHDPPVSSVSNAVTYVTQGTDPENPQTDLVQEKATGFATNENKRSYQKQEQGRLHRSNGRHKEPVLSERGGRGEDLSSPERGTYAKKRSNSPVSFNAEPLNVEDLAKMFHVLQRTGLYTPWRVNEMKSLNDQAVQCNMEPFCISPDHHSGRGKGHAHWEAGRAHSHRASLTSPRHMSTPRSGHNRERSHRQRDCSQAFCIKPHHRRSHDHRQPMEQTDTDSCSSYSEALCSSSSADSECPVFVAKLKLPRKKRGIKLKDLTLGDCRVVERSCEHHHSRQCSHHGNHHHSNHGTCSIQHRHHSCKRGITNDGNHVSSRHHHNGRHSCRRTSPSLNKLPVEKEDPHRPTVTVYGESVVVISNRSHPRSSPNSLQERPGHPMVPRQAPPPPPCNTHNETKLREACHLAEKLKRHSRRMEWDLSLSVSRHYSHSFI